VNTPPRRPPPSVPLIVTAVSGPGVMMIRARDAKERKERSGHPANSGVAADHQATLRRCLLSSRSRVRVAVGAQVRRLEPRRPTWLGAKVLRSCHVRDASPAPWVRRGRYLLGRREEPVHGCDLAGLRA
jgi:hypothetical protein